VDFITSNIGALIGIVGGLGLGWIVVKWAISSLVTVQSADLLGDQVKKYVQKLKKADPATGILVRDKLILVFEEIIKDLQEIKKNQ